MQEKLTVRYALRRSLLAASLGFLAAIGARADAADAFIPRLINSSTVPANGDINPYGVAFVPVGFPAGGKIAAGAGSFAPAAMRCVPLRKENRRSSCGMANRSSNFAAKSGMNGSARMPI